ncbi:MAG: uracil-DNA glycosylase [Anaerolineales bacterium]|nr:uracil-DNA glycosylase [Anaerolineales bacterium]
MSELTELYKEVAVCQRCELSQGRTQTVPGEGPENAEIMFIGEAPGFHEDRQGRPFVGAAGKFLDELLASIGLTREDVYICNVIKCRPPSNRDPQPDEMAACKPFLDKQIELVRPKLIITLGRYSMARYFPNTQITRIHGQPKRIGNRIYYPMFHPAAALHQPKWRAVVKEDMLKIPQILKEAAQLGEAEPLEQAEQLSLF